MEYLEGRPTIRFDEALQRRTGARGGQRPRSGPGLVAEALAGLHYAHELGDYDGSRSTSSTAT